VSETLKFKLFYLIRYIGDALFSPFLSLYFVAKGINETELGILFAITPLVTILVNPMWNWIVKDARISRLILQVMTLVEGALIIVLTQVSGFELFALIVALMAFLCSPYLSIQDGFTAIYTNKNKLDYTSIRIYASIAYVAALAMAAAATLIMDYAGLFLIAAGFYIATGFVARWIKPVEAQQPESERPKRDIKALLKNAQFWKYLVFYTIMIGSVRIGDTFYGVYMTADRGLNNLEFGIVFAAFIVAEVLVMQGLLVQGSGWKEKPLYVAAALMFAFRFLIYGIGAPNWAIIAVTMLRGVSWGIILYAHIKYMVKIVRVENVFASILMISLSFSLYTGIGNLIFGKYIESHGYQSFYLIHMGLILFSLLIYLTLTPKLRQASPHPAQGDSKC